MFSRSLITVFLVLAHQLAASSSHLEAELSCIGTDRPLAEPSQSWHLSLLQTSSFVHSSHSMPSHFFEDALPTPVRHSENRREIVESPSALFDVGSNSVPMPQWAIEDASSIAHGPADATAMPSRGPVSLTQSTATASVSASHVDGVKHKAQRHLSGAHADTSKDSVLAKARPSFAKIDESLASAALKVVETEPPLAAETAASEPDVPATSEGGGAVALAETEGTETEHAAGTEQVNEDFKHWDGLEDADSPEVAVEFAECQEDAAGENCMKAKQRNSALEGRMDELEGRMEALRAQQKRLNLLTKLHAQVRTRNKMFDGKIQALEQRGAKQHRAEQQGAHIHALEEHLDNAAALMQRPELELPTVQSQPPSLAGRQTPLSDYKLFLSDLPELESPIVHSQPLSWTRPELQSPIVQSRPLSFIGQQTPLLATSRAWPRQPLAELQLAPRIVPQVHFQKENQVLQTLDEKIKELAQHINEDQQMVDTFSRK